MKTTMKIFILIAFCVSVGSVNAELLEMADGQYAAFPMSEKDIQLEKIREASKTALKEERQRADELREYCESIDVVEMADGNIAVFGKTKGDTAYDFKPLECAYYIK